MSGPSSRRTLTAVLIAATLAGCGDAPSAPPASRLPVPGVDLAIYADQRLADADAAIEKAILLVLNAQNPSAPRPTRPFGGHDEKAIRHLEAARDEIAKAQAYADGTTP